MKTAPTSSKVVNGSATVTTTELPLAYCQTGPKCFLVYINDLSTPVTLYNICGRQYIIQSKWYKRCFCNPRISVIIATGWTLQNHVKINSGKSKEMMFSYEQDGNIQYTMESFAYFFEDNICNHLPPRKPFLHINNVTSYASYSLFLNHH